MQCRSQYLSIVFVKHGNALVQIQQVTVSQIHACRFFTARRINASAVLEVVILSVRLSVCLSHVCFVTKRKRTADILIPRERTISVDTDSEWYKRRPVPSKNLRLK